MAEKSNCIRELMMWSANRIANKETGILLTNERKECTCYHVKKEER